MAHYTYLLLNLFTISIPFALSFESKVQFYKKWKYYLPSLFITALLFLIWDYYKTKFGVWQFNDDFIIGIKFFGLPIEEYFFFFTVPYSCTFIYEVVAYYNKRNFPKNIQTIKGGTVVDDKDFAFEKNRLIVTIEEMYSGGKECCTDHPHPIMGSYTPEEWGKGMYKHLDHHLRQFGV